MISFDAFREATGVSVAVFSERSDGDCATPEGREAFCAACGIASCHVVRGHQIHGVRVARVGEAEQGSPPIPETDGLVTDKAGLPLAVLVADCVPVFLADPVRGVLGLVHAGREGTRLGIVTQALSKMTDEWGGIPANVHALVGPSAGPCCYEVSREMAHAWTQAGLPARGRNLDLWEANVRQLVDVGVPRAHVHVYGACTVCDGRFFSHRAHADGGRNMALVSRYGRGQKIQSPP